ncbi:uncharacterized protein Z518_01937 [Rhinocladiella mackenziei CBS 650.93]|uniref:Rhinocladiella mackenziei CBS 650.93 unplaced genomic scaffold supercont1.2, whole genome shotgun sequence n=1 Tax=Rhinocladiella mackenziei CBS 650.93 TaxID=1442369 RepID=A0A0D2IN81_9EURO|nr:uncharacterized protein Z518_01937 [Rhinocladiella mackenziei CBS 650.93]KIX07284.1 hypothetical protein Z518_01937 [Rhinocladiella mackenziei CBS 650.93]
MQSYAKQQYGERTYTSLQSILEDPAPLLINSGLQVKQSRPVGGDLDILSASYYPHGPMQTSEGRDRNPRKRKAVSSDPFYGGLVFTAGTVGDSNHSSSAEQEQPPTPRKRKTTKQASVNDVDEPGEGKKQRGRPRVDTQDETAADRRRTQIRLAQRAYRHRKETTISALKQKVTNLQNTIEQMNRTFITLHDNMVDAGILTSHHALGRQLQAATEEFVALSKAVSPDSDDEEDKMAKMARGESEHLSESGETGRSGSVQDASKPSSRPAQRANVGRGTTFDQSSTDAEADVEEVPLMTYHDADDPSNALLALSQSVSGLDTSNLHGLNDALSFNTMIPETFPFDDPSANLSIERPLKPASSPTGSYTYSFQETTFARRLHRMCLERAFRNLTNPNIDPEYIKRAFRFTFCFSNRKRMLQRFQEMLKRRAGESLENWNVPFFHIGGAGTHFPRRDDDGNPIYPPNMVSPAKAFGPQPWIEVETPRMEKSTQEMLDNIGFGGVWYDSHDVEEYLKTKGIYLDGQSSFVEVDPSVVSLLRASRTSSTGPSDDSPHEPGIRTPSPLLGLPDPIADPFIARELGEMFAQPFLGAAVSTTPDQQQQQQFGANKSDNDAWLDFQDNLNTPSFSDLLSRRQAPMTFDVEMFLERMIESSACLGRAPGFRKEAIDNALALSLQECF